MMLVTTETVDAKLTRPAGETVTAADLEILTHLLNLTAAMELGQPLETDWTRTETAKLQDLYSKLCGKHVPVADDPYQDQLF